VSRTLSGPLAAHLATRTHTRCKMLRLDLRDGTSIGLTDHDQPISFDLGDGAISYKPDTGILTSDLVLSAGFDADNFEISGPIDSVVTRTLLLGGRFNRARVRLFMINWASLGSGPIRLMAGNIADARPDSGRFVFQVRSDMDRFNQTVGRTITPWCDADFGDARCTFSVPTTAAVVTAVAGDMAFSVSYSGTFANDAFNFGSATFTSGALAGTAPMEIFDSLSSGAGAGSIALFAPLAAVPGIGDAVTLRTGCAKTRAACQAYANILHFRGFPEVPGSDQVLKVAVPGQ
jgi:uncharacterized phage protein (TIGR02218 family)